MEKNKISRRTFFKSIGLLGIGLLTTSTVKIINKEEYLIPYNILGKTGLKVSCIALGGAANYGYGIQADHNSYAYKKMLDYLFNSGINYFDTSSDYNTEDEFSILCQPNIRPKIILSTKINKTGNEAIKEIEKSLKRLKTDYIDIIYFHNIGIENNNEINNLTDEQLKTIDIIDKLIKKGMIRFKGISSHNPKLFENILKTSSDKIDVIMGFHSLLTHFNNTLNSTLSEWENIFELANKKNIGTVGMKILLGGHKQWNERSDELKKTESSYRQLEQYLKNNLSIAQACIKWSINNKSINTRVIGMRTIQEAKENLATFKNKKILSISGIKGSNHGKSQYI